MSRRAALTLATALLLAPVLAACGDDGDTVDAGGAGGAGTAGTLAGRTFLSTGVTEDGGERPLVEGTRIRLDFEDSRVGASAGCNSMSGTARIEDARIVVSEVGGTEMGCQPDLHEQDTWLAGFLAADPSYVLAGDRLTLTGGGTTVELVDEEAADPDRPLEGTAWELDGMVEGEAVSSVPAGTGATLVFSAGRVTVTVQGCNRGGGAVLTADDTLTFEPVTLTEMACDDAPSQVEAAVLAVLQDEVSYAIDARTLTLNHPSGKGLVLRGESG